jgi:arsenate reductase
MNILFLCTGNSCRSLISEAVFNHLAPSGWQAISAGSQPTGKLNDKALALLARKGISTTGYYSKSWDDLPLTPDVVVTVCASAAGETCPAYLGQVLRTHWGVEDPSHVIGTEAEIDAAFEKAYAILRARIEAFLTLPLEELAAGLAKFKTELDRIGSLDA